MSGDKPAGLDVLRLNPPLEHATLDDETSRSLQGRQIAIADEGARHMNADAELGGDLVQSEDSMGTMPTLGLAELRGLPHGSGFTVRRPTVPPAPEGLVHGRQRRRESRLPARPNTRSLLDATSPPGVKILGGQARSRPSPGPPACAAAGETPRNG